MYKRQVDASSSTALEQIVAVEEVLGELGARGKETILVLNKIDKASEEALANIREHLQYEDIIEVSAKEEINLDSLLNLIEEKLPYSLIKAEYLIPYDKGDVASFLHRNGRVFQEEYTENGTFMVVEIDEETYNKSKEYSTQVLN